MSTTVTEESKNFELDLQNYFRHAQKLIRYHRNPFQLKSIQLSFSVFHLANIDKSESEHLKNLAKELIYRKAVHIIDANDAKCQLAVVRSLETDKRKREEYEVKDKVSTIKSTNKSWDILTCSCFVSNISIITNISSGSTPLRYVNVLL